MQNSKNGWLKKIWTLLYSSKRWCDRRRQSALDRRWLVEMDDRLLKDIGLSRADIPRLYQRPQSAPAHERDEPINGDDDSSRYAADCKDGGNAVAG